MGDFASSKRDMASQENVLGPVLIIIPNLYTMAELKICTNHRAELTPESESHLECP